MVMTKFLLVLICFLVMFAIWTMHRTGRNSGKQVSLSAKLPNNAQGKCCYI